MVTVINSYDALNQLVSTVTNANTVINAYNGEGLRVAKTVNGAVTKYLYEYDKVILEIDGNGSPIARNVYGTNLLARTVGGQTLFYMYNGHADVTALLDAATGNVAATYYYDAFGNIQDQTGSINNNITYAGYQYDKETGLYYLNARMYDPITARFMQEDTYRGDLNDPLSLNLYTYGANNPIKYDDPSGHVFNLVAAAIGAVAGAAINTGITAVTDYLDDGEFNKGWKDYAGAAVSGAIGGAAAGITLGGSLVATVAADAAIGVVLSTAGNVVEQEIVKGKINAEEVGWSALSGGLGGGLGRALGFGAKIEKVVEAGRTGMVHESQEKIKDVLAKGMAKDTGTISKKLLNVAETQSDRVGVRNGGVVGVGTEGGSKADFYVMPSGQAVPSTGYRYMSENAPYLDELSKTMVIPKNPNGTYFSFDKFDVASPGKLQVPHDASVRGSFDTLQIIDDLRVPNGNWGNANHLEPLTRDFPEFGPGGASQVITNQSIRLEELIKLMK
ncbi:MAG: RHS repeat-associated core domain-containing protein [Desulfitobacteriaceae bacterium]